MNFKLACAIAALSMGAAASAQAADWYVGGSLGASNYKIDMSGTTSSDKSDTGYKLLVGARLTPNVAIEGGYADLGKAKATVPVNGTPVNLALKGTGLFLDVVGSAPVAANWSLFGKLGMSSTKIKGTLTVASTSASETDTSTQVHYGVGGQYDVSKNIGIRAEWERFRGRFNKSGIDLGKGDADLLSVGVTYSF